MVLKKINLDDCDVELITHYSTINYDDIYWTRSR